ncbi:hypothetical protein Sphch_2752 [Sphingobium chlorophenolicum L-1]|uniref:Glycosyltransferase RgtA/B/C/D-like domain-containing protein n=1 Tax=Sphingobium chlorophenolicum L-1 TaxID=690566 RepID=F6F0S1_SPHCR|nr:hypothetical protein [Sphingobium chlorophenolicum]AEG50393.1 hypothetical protein Sphch_2752 [Sphingobium chlorophenolicum L-1]
MAADDGVAICKDIIVQKKSSPRNSTCLWLAGVFLASFLLQFFLMDLRLNPYDEGLVLVDAMRTLNGDVIHRDYYSPYGPATYYILAGLFKLDDHWFILGRIYGLTVMSGIVTAFFGLLIKRTTLTTAFTFTGLCLALLLGTPFYLYPLFPSVLLSLIGSTLLLRWFQKERSQAILLAGCMTGAIALFRYDAGFFVAVAHSVALASHILLSSGSAGQRYRKIAQAGMLYGGGVAIVFLPFAATYLRFAPISAFYNDIIDYPLRYYAAMRGLPFPNPIDSINNPEIFVIYLPILAFFISISEIFKIYSRKKIGLLNNYKRIHFALILIFTPLAAILYYKGVVRVSPMHMIMSFIPSLLLFSIFFTRAWGKDTTSGHIGAVLILALAFWATVPPALERVISDLEQGKTPLNILLAHEVLSERRSKDRNCPNSPRMALSYQDYDYDMAGKYIRRFTEQNEKIFVGLDRHDKIFVNSVYLYFSSERNPGTHWHQFDPGIQTRSDIQSNIVNDIRKNRVRWVIRDGNFENVHEPNKSSQSSGVHILDHYLAGRYHRVARFGALEIWLINEATAPHISNGDSCFGLPANSSPVATPI